MSFFTKKAAPAKSGWLEKIKKLAGTGVGGAGGYGQGGYAMAYATGKGKGYGKPPPPPAYGKYGKPPPPPAYGKYGKPFPPYGKYQQISPLASGKPVPSLAYGKPLSPSAYGLPAPGKPAPPKRPRGTKRKNVLAMASLWTGDAYEKVRDARRSGRTNDPVALRTNWALVRSMRDAQTRVPHRPLGCDSVTTLYRGMGLPRSAFDRFVRQGFIDDPSFVAFSAKLDVAESFARRAGQSFEKFVLVLDVRDIPTGTPWLWFGRSCSNVPGGDHGDDDDDPFDLVTGLPLPRFLPRHGNSKTRIRSEFGGEREVLLPPGRLTLQKRLGGDRWQVKYDPDTAATSLRKDRTGRGVRIFPKGFGQSKSNDYDPNMALYKLFENDAAETAQETAPVPAAAAKAANDAAARARKQRAASAMMAWVARKRRPSRASENAGLAPSTPKGVDARSAFSLRRVADRRRR